MCLYRSIHLASSYLNIYSIIRRVKFDFACRTVTYDKIAIQSPRDALIKKGFEQFTVSMCYYYTRTNVNDG